jgi:hypothetical protein
MEYQTCSSCSHKSPLLRAIGGNYKTNPFVSASQGVHGGGDASHRIQFEQWDSITERSQSIAKMCEQCQTYKHAPLCSRSKRHKLAAVIIVDAASLIISQLSATEQENIYPQKWYSTVANLRRSQVMKAQYRPKLGSRDEHLLLKHSKHSKQIKMMHFKTIRQIMSHDKDTCTLLKR